MPPPLSVAIPLEDAPAVLIMTLVAFMVAVKVASIPCAPLLLAVMVSADNTRLDPDPVAKAPLAPVPVEVIELFDKVIVLPPFARTAAFNPKKLLESVDVVLPVVFMVLCDNVYTPSLATQTPGRSDVDAEYDLSVWVTVPPL